MLKKLILFVFLILSAEKNFAQISRVLIVLDGSGSMKQKFQQQVKFELAGNILVSFIDSMERTNPKVEFALRVLGHQYPKAQNNCKDTKLEVPFAKKNSENIKQALKRITPQGQTPITYSLEQSLNDFPKDTTAFNSIILITDGIETCNGNPCDLAESFQQKRIALKPFIVGLGITDSLKKFFNCLGTYYDVADENEFGGVLNAVVKQALNRTTVQVNLLDAYGMPTETNVEMSFLDHYSQKTLFNFIHTLDANGIPDTLRLDPKGRYDLIIHTFPSARKNNIELLPGKHNMIALDIPQGKLDLKIDGQTNSYTPVQCIVRKVGTEEILYVQDFNSTRKYLAGDYDLEILTVPRIYKYGVRLQQSPETVIHIAVPGTVTLQPMQLVVATLLFKENNTLTKVYDFNALKSNTSLQIQPGEYILISRPDKGKRANLTQQKIFTVSSNKTTQVKL